MVLRAELELRVAASLEEEIANSTVLRLLLALTVP